MKTSESIGKIAMSLLKAQRVIGGAAKGSNNPFFKSKYADLGAVMQACKDALNDNDIAVLQPVGMEGDKTYVETILLHSSGEYISDRMLVTIVPTPVKKDSPEMIVTPQAQGSAITYARRYGLQSMLFIPAEDDDANSASQNREDVRQETRQPATATRVKSVANVSSLPNLVVRRRAIYDRALDLGQFQKGKTNEESTEAFLAFVVPIIDAAIVNVEQLTASRLDTIEAYLNSKDAA